MANTAIESQAPGADSGVTGAAITQDQPKSAQSRRRIKKGVSGSGRRVVESGALFAGASPEQWNRSRRVTHEPKKPSISPDESNTSWPILSRVQRLCSEQVLVTVGASLCRSSTWEAPASQRGPGGLSRVLPWLAQVKRAPSLGKAALGCGFMSASRVGTWGGGFCRASAHRKQKSTPAVKCPPRGHPQHPSREPSCCHGGPTASRAPPRRRPGPRSRSSCASWAGRQRAHTMSVLPFLYQTHPQQERNDKENTRGAEVQNITSPTRVSRMHEETTPCNYCGTCS